MHNFIMTTSTVVLFGGFLKVAAKDVEVGGLLHFTSKSIAFGSISVIVDSF